MNIESPKDWNSREEWNSYYDEVIANGDFHQQNYGGSVGFRFGQYVENWKTKDKKKIWVAGCGVSMLPKLLEKCGFEVYATDFSEKAIAFQKSVDDEILKNIAVKMYGWDFPPEIAKNSIKGGRLICEVQDFLYPYKENYFDLILNIRALQKFDFPTIKTIASRYLDALKPLGHAQFEMINVNAEFSDSVENILIDAGFVIPEYTLNRCSLQALIESVKEAKKAADPQETKETLAERRNHLFQKLFDEKKRENQRKIEFEASQLLNPQVKTADVRFGS